MMQLVETVSRIASRNRLFLMGFVFFFLLGAFVFFTDKPRASSLQPIAFNHAKHIEAGLECTTCHVGAEDQQHATLPTLETCSLCHPEALTESPEEAKLLAFAGEGKELDWVQHTRLPQHVYFSHRRHVRSGQLECSTCHGPMQEMIVPPLKPLAGEKLTMDGCIACHLENEARTDCNDCHI